MNTVAENNKSVVAEQYLIGAVLLGGATTYDLVADRVDELCFVLPEHQRIWRAIADFGTAGNEFDCVSVAEVLGDFEVNGNAALGYLFELANNVPSASSVEIYSRVVAGRSTLARMRKVMADGQHMLEQAGGDVEEKISRVQDMVFAVSAATIQTSLHDSQSFVGAAMGALAERSRRDVSAVTGISTNISGLDDMTSGLHPGQLVVVAGRPSMGKTAFATGVGVHNAIEHDKSVAIFSMEMEAGELGIRLLSWDSGVDGKRLKTGRLIAGDWDRLKSSAVRIGNAKLWIEDGSAMTVPKIRTVCRKLQQQHGLDLVIIDYLQLMSGGSNRKNENRTAEISEITRGLKLLAKELKVPVIALSQLSRDIEKRPNKRPLMSDLRESGAIEQDADVIVFVYRDEVYNPDSPDKGTAELIVAKQRSGAIGDVRVGFIGAQTKFVDRIAANEDLT